MSRSPAGRAEIRRDLAVLALSTGFFFFVSLGARDLWNPNEPTYGLAVVEMAARGEWAVPTVNGLVFAEKPILYYWLALLAAKVLGGAHELALRVPSAAAGVAGVLLVYLLVCPRAGRRRACIAAALLATTFQYWWNARSVQMDLLVCVAILATVTAVVGAVERSDEGLRRGWILAGAAAGFGFLAKGPVAWICPAAILVTYLLIERRIRSLATSGMLVAAVLAVALAGSWTVILLARGETAVIREVLFRQNVQRFLDPWDHRGPWWYYLKYFWIDFAPWSWLVPLAAVLPGRDADERRLDRLAWIWLGMVTVFFSLSGSKRSPYILPAAPAVAVLVSGLCERLVARRLERWRTTATLVAVGGMAALAVAVGVALRSRAIPALPDLALVLDAVVALLVAGGIAILASLALRARAPAAATTALFSLVVALELFAAVVALPAADGRKSVRTFCERVSSIVPSDASVRAFLFWEFRGSYPFYLSRPLPNLRSVGALREYWRDSGRVFVIVEGTNLDAAREVIGDQEALVRAGVGQNTAYLFANR